MFKKAIHKLGYFGLLAAAMLFIAPAVSANEVIRWNQIATAAAAAAETDPLTESRIFTILHVAIHDAANAIDRRYDSYRLQSLSMPQASVTAAIAAAAHTTLTELMPGAKPTFDAALKEVLHSIPNGDGKTQGLQVGREAALAILAERKNDGANRTVTRAPGIKPGEYRPTPPDLTPAFLPQWGEVTPFALRSSAQFRPGALPAVNSPQAIADLEEVKAIGAEKSPSRTAQQSEIARYWYENSTQGWNRIARAVLEARQLDEWENARLFALVNMAMADGFIGGFEAKYHYHYWRPATAIRDGGDSEWLNYLWTPPVPDYPSTHTVLGAAAATVLAKFFGTDFMSFEMTSGAPYPGITREFWSFSEAARENGASRVFAGIHFSTAVKAGYVQGEQIGIWAFEHFLRPISGSPEGITSK